MPPVASPAPPPSAAVASAPSPSPAALATPSITITGPSAGSIIVPASLPPPPPPAHPDHQPASATTTSTTASKRADKEKNHHSASAMASTASGGTQPGGASKQGQGSFMAVGIAAGAEDAKYQAKYKELKRKVKEIESDNDKLHFKVQQAKTSIRRMKMERAVLYERLSAVPPTSPPTDRVAAPSIDGVLGQQSSSQHHSQQQQAIQQQPSQHSHYAAPQPHHRQHTPSSQQAQYTNNHPSAQPTHYAPPPPVPQSPVYAAYPGAQHDAHPSSSRSARERDMYAMSMDPAVDAPHARQLLSPRGGPLSAQPGSATALYPPPLPSAGYEGSPPVRHRSHSGSRRSTARPPSAGAYRSHYLPEGPMGIHSPPPSDRDRDIRDRERERDRYERERGRDRERDSRVDRKSHGHGHYDERERRLSEAQDYDAFYERGGPPPPPSSMGHYGPSHSPQTSMAPQILSPRSATSTGRMHPHQRLGPGTYVNRDGRERDRDDYMDDLRRDPRDARHTDVDQMRILEQQRDWEMREREMRDRDRERERDSRRSDRDRERHRDRAERERDRDQDYYRERDFHYRERERDYAPPSSGRGDLPPSNSTIRASPHLHPRTVSNSGTASSRSRSQIDSRPGEYEHHHVSSAQPPSANGAPGYYQDGYARVSRSGTPPSREGEAHSRSDSRSRDYYDRDGGRSSGRSAPQGSSYRIRRDDADYVAGGPPPADMVPGHPGNGSSGGGNTPAAESRKRSRTEMEMDVDSGDVDGHGDPDAGASIAAGGIGAANHSALPDAGGPSSEDRSAKRYHRDHSSRRSIDALEDSRLGPS